MGDPIQLAPFDFASDEEEARRRAREAELMQRSLERLQMPRAAPAPTQENVEAQAMGDAYRAMSDDEADTIQGRSRDEGPGGRVYAAGDIPPPENQRQRMMDAPIARAGQRASAAVAGQMAALDAPTDRQRPRWMRDREDPAGEMRNDEVAFRSPTSGPAPSPGSAAPMASTRAGDAQALTPPSASPAGRDHTGADVGDAIQAAALMFSNILNAVTGQQPSGLQFHSRGREEREQDRVEALAQRNRSEASAARQAARAQTLAMQREGLDRADARAQAARDQRAELAGQDPRRAAFQREVERQAQLREVDSFETNTLRSEVRVARDVLPGPIRNALGLTDARLAAMNGAELERVAERIPRPSVGIRGSGGSPGASGGPRGGDSGESVIRDAVASGIPESTARAMYANPRTRAQLMNRIATHPGTQAAPGAANIEDDPLYQEALRQGVPPVTAREMAQDPDERSRLRRSMTGAGISERRANEAAGNDRDVAIAAARDSLRSLNEALPPEGQDIPGIGTVDSLRGEGIFASPAGRRMRTLAQNAVRRYLRLESGAAISDQEMEAEMRLRGLGPGATEQQFRDGIRDLQADLDARAQRRERGSSNQTAPQQRPASDMVEMVTPGGQRIRVPRANVAEAQRRGATLSQGAQ